MGNKVNGSPTSPLGVTFFTGRQGYHGFIGINCSTYILSKFIRNGRKFRIKAYNDQVHYLCKKVDCTLWRVQALVTYSTTASEESRNPKPVTAPLKERQEIHAMIVKSSNDPQANEIVNEPFVERTLPQHCTAWRKHIKWQYKMEQNYLDDKTAEYNDSYFCLSLYNWKKTMKIYPNTIA